MSVKQLVLALVLPAALAAQGASGLGDARPISLDEAIRLAPRNANSRFNLALMYAGRGMAREAIALIGRFLRRAVKDGSDLEARDGMALAATLGGLAFSNSGVALVHAMEYPVGGAVHVSHGAGVSALIGLLLVLRRLLAMVVRRIEQRLEQHVSDVDRRRRLGDLHSRRAAGKETQAVPARAARSPASPKEKGRAGRPAL